MFVPHLRLLDMVRPSSFALVTLSSSLPSTAMGANWGSFFTKDILSSFAIELDSILHIPLRDLICDILGKLRLPVATTSYAVVSSTYFHTLAKLSTSKSFISTRNSHRPNFVPWRTPEGNEPYSE